MEREKVESSILLIFFILSLIVCGYWVYFRLTWNRTTWSTYKGSILSYTEEKTYPIEINYFSNKMNNGIPLIEFKLTGYTDTSLDKNEDTGKYAYKDTYSYGFQMYSNNTEDSFYDYQYKRYWKINDACHISEREWRLKNTNYYYSYEDNTFGSGKQMVSNASIIMDLDGKLCKLNPIGLVFNPAEYSWVGKNTWKQYTHDLNYFFHFMIENVLDYFKEPMVGSYVVDLSDFFSIEMFDEQSGQFYKATNSTTEKVYITCKVSKSDDGFISSKQSLFGFYKNDAEYGSNTNNYWKSLTDYTITERDLIYTKYSDNTYTARLSDKCIDYITKFSDMNIDLKIDLDSYYLSNRNIEIYALEKDFLGGLKVSNISIVSQENRVIRLYENYDNLSLVNVTAEVL